jgi:hypothetical protein
MFNETEWTKILFLLADTGAWIKEMEKDLFCSLPAQAKCRLFRKTYYLSSASLAHILERHYYKISRHPGCGKFTVDIPTIVHWIRESFFCEPMAIPGSLNFKRNLDTLTQIGFDKDGLSTTIITVITDPGGEIKTAFPGQYSNDTKIPCL